MILKIVMMISYKGDFIVTAVESSFSLKKKVFIFVIVAKLQYGWYTWSTPLAVVLIFVKFSQQQFR